MKIHLIRHAEPFTSAKSGKDIDRALCELGLKQAAKLGIYMKEKCQNLEVWCSSAVRTQQTLEILSGHVELGESKFYPNFYLCPKETLLNELRESESSEDLILIGHNFGISHFISHLTDDYIEMSTGEYYCIDFGSLNRKELSVGTGIIVDHYQP